MVELGSRLITAELRKKVGIAAWLWSLLVNLAPAEWNDGSAWVAERSAISDKQLAHALDASPKDIARWRRRLKKCGLLDWHIVPGEGRAYRVIAPRIISESDTVTTTARDALTAAARFTVKMDAPECGQNSKEQPRHAERMDLNGNRFIH